VDGVAALRWPGVMDARPRFLLFFFFFLRFSFFPVFPGSGLYLDLFFFLSGSLFFMWGGGFVW
jgi:hypothetical protein